MIVSFTTFSEERRCLGIPDAPTEADIRRVLDYLQVTPCIKWATENLEEIQRLRGTPGEPIPIKRPLFTERLRWRDEPPQNETHTINNTTVYAFEFTCS